MLDADTIKWSIIAISAVMVGIAKTGIPGIGILVVPLMAAVMPSRESTGVLLGILILADVFAAGYYRRKAQFGHIIRLLPATFVGIVAGYFGLKYVNNQQLKPVIGIIVLAMLTLNYWRNKKDGQNIHLPNKWWFIAVMGFLAGLTTMMANAAGPVMIIYLLAAGLPKVEFVGTAAWFFFIVNWIKVPFSAKLQLMTLESIKLNLTMLPLIALGAFIGILVLKRIKQKWFRIIVQILATAAAIKLIIP